MLLLLNQCQEYAYAFVLFRRQFLRRPKNHNTIMPNLPVLS